jgi:hypothetical protein
LDFDKDALEKSGAFFSISRNLFRQSLGNIITAEEWPDVPRVFLKEKVLGGPDRCGYLKSIRLSLLFRPEIGFQKNGIDVIG